MGKGGTFTKIMVREGKNFWGSLFYLFIIITATDNKWEHCVTRKEKVNTEESGHIKSYVFNSFLMVVGSCAPC